MKLKFVQEFKDFALKGNVMDMAVGIIIGTAFGRIVSSFVSDILMPPLGMLLGETDFSKLSVVLNPEKVAMGAEAVTWNYGAFIQACFDFLILALCIFMLIRLLNSLKRKKEAAAAPPEPTKEQVLLTEIRDLLAKDSKK